MRAARVLLSLPALLGALVAAAQVTISWPPSNTVFQRGAVGAATLRLVVCSQGTQPLRNVWVRLSRYDTSSRRTPVLPEAIRTTDGWQPTQLTSGAGTARAICEVEAVPGGLYAVQVRANDSLSREVTIGVGEVFAIAGQSNASGAVNCGELPTQHPEFVQFFNVKTACPEHDPGGRAFPGGSNACSGPTKEFRFYWGALGDLFAERLGVPVVFYQTAYSGSQVNDWDRSSQGQVTRFGPAVPYGSLKMVLTGLVRQTGLRAVLWHQGESDHLTPGYDAALNRVIGQTWTDAGFNVPWVVAQASYNGGTTSPALIRQQVRLIGYASHANVDPNAAVKPYGDPFPGPFGRWGVFAGPFTDTLGAEARCDNVHFGEAGQERVARLWFDALTQHYTVPGLGESGNFLTNSLPLVARSVPMDVVCNETERPLVTQVRPNGGDKRLRFGPNPTSGSVVVQWELTQAGPVRVQVFNLTGTVIRTWQHDGQAGENKVDLDLTAYPAGLYGLRLEGSGLQSTALRLLKTER